MRRAGFRVPRDGDSVAPHVEEDQEAQGAPASQQGEPRQAPQHGSRLTPRREPLDPTGAAGPPPAASCCPGTATVTAMTTTRREDVVDDHHGTPVPDPYRWLEQGDEPEVRAWVAAQNARTRDLLDAIPARGRWLERLVALMGEPVVMGAQVRGELVVLLERERDAQQARLAVRRLDDPASAPTVLADPAAGTDDAAAAVDWFFASPDGSLVAYGVSEGGTESSVLRIARTTDGRHLADEIPNCRACSVAWDADATGFHYTRYPDGDEYHRTVHHHTIGDDWHADPVVWAEHPTPQTWPDVDASPDGRFLLVSAMVGWGRYDIHLLDRSTGEWRTLIGGVEAVTAFAFEDDTTLLGMTTLDASRGRVVRVDATDPPDSPSGWTTVTGERDVVVGAPRIVPDGHYLVATRGGVDRIEWWPTGSTVPRLVAGLDIVAVAGIAADRTTGTALALVTGFDQPTALHRIEPDPVSSAPTAAHWFPIDIGDHPSLAVRQIEYPSADGTSIGLFLVHRHDVDLNPDTPTILNGYGGFAITESPVWSPTIAAWCGAGGLYAIAGLRGGAEHGEEWHRGKADIMLDPIVSLWDVACLKPIVEEAGGRFSDLQGLSKLGTSCLASNGHLHEDLLAFFHK